jgi:anti-anti-sigma factor
MARPPQPRLLETEPVGGVTVVRFACAEIWGTETVRDVADRLTRLADIVGPRLVLDFGKVDRMDSTMLGQLIALHKKIQAAGGRLALCRLNTELLEVFETLKLNRLLAIYADEQEALGSF